MPELQLRERTFYLKEESLEEQLFLDQHFSSCHLCPRECGAARMEGRAGACGAGAVIKVARAALHLWEEPCISGKEGSGAVFFSGCPLGCIYCQNQEISRGQAGYEITVDRLADIFLELQNDKKANNINLVTACHYVPQVVLALQKAKKGGLAIPVVYNSSGYEKVETLKMLDGLVDVYLPDFKYWDPELAVRYSRAADYPKTVRAAIAEMVRQTGPCEFDGRGLIRKGVIVRQLLLPGHVKNSKDILGYLYNTYHEDIYISIMSQYTPMPQVKEDPLLGRRVTVREYQRLIDYALELGIENGYTQERKVALESFIPDFDGEGVLGKMSKAPETAEE